MDGAVHDAGRAARRGWARRDRDGLCVCSARLCVLVLFEGFVSVAVVSLEYFFCFPEPNEEKTKEPMS